MTTNADEPQVGIGLYRGPGERWEGPPGERAPAAPFDGGADNSGQMWLSLRDSIERLGAFLARNSEPDEIAGIASGNTDASGNVWIPVYQVVAGMEVRVARITANALNPATGVPYTAASTFSAAAAYMHLHFADGNNSNDLARGTLFDFAPATAAGPIFPGLFEYGTLDTPFAPGPKWLMLHVNAGPVSTQVYARYQLKIRRQRGIA